MNRNFEWDEEKNKKNIEKHGFSFNRALEIFNDSVLTMEDRRQEYGETRLISIGIMEKFLIIVVVHVNRKGTTRLISARKANQKERASYEKFKRKNA